MVGAASASTAQSVRLVMLLTKTRRTLRHLDECLFTERKTLIYL